MLKISVTTLEQFRRYLNQVSGQDTEQAVIDRVKRKFKDTENKQIGSAWHKLIEDLRLTTTSFKSKSKYWCISEGIAFPKEEALKARAYRMKHKMIVCEVPVSKVYKIGANEITVTGRIDGIAGLHIRDAKVKFFEPDVNYYMDSCQGKFYMDILQCKVCHYDVFEVVQPTVKEVMPAYGSTVDDIIYRKTGGYKLTKGDDGISYLNRFQVIAHEPITCSAYIGMQNDLHVLLLEFLKWVALKGLEKYITV